MTPAQIFVALQQTRATLRVEGDYLVASNAKRIAPAIKAAIRENKPQLMAALAKAGCKAANLEILATGPPYRRTFAHLQLKPLAYIPVGRWQKAIEDGRAFLAKWAEQAQALDWRSTDLFGLHTPPAVPHPSYQRLSRYDVTGLIWLLEGREVVALTDATASIRNPKSGSVTIYRKNNKPALGPLGDSLDDFA